MTSILFALCLAAKKATGISNGFESGFDQLNALHCTVILISGGCVQTLPKHLITAIRLSGSK